MKKENRAKAHYEALRGLSCAELWEREVAAFDRMAGGERVRNVAVVRAVGVVFSAEGEGEERARAREWLRGLLKDPEEKVRRYAINALPKLGGGGAEERELLGLLKRTEGERERAHLGKALGKLGSSATLGAGRLSGDDLRRVAANVARAENPGRVVMDRELVGCEGMRVHFRCRAGLEDIVADEVREGMARGVRVAHCGKGLVVGEVTGRVALRQLFTMRCFASVGMVLGEVASGAGEAENLAGVIAGERAREVFRSWTEGPARYRLEFVARGHQRSLVREVASRVYRIDPLLLNDSRSALWQVDVHPGPRGNVVELQPRLRPDPRFSYRAGDVPAASHPPLAACMVRLAGRQREERVWDPFCGSGLELAERILAGGVSRVLGTDSSAEAVEIARRNLMGLQRNRVQTDLRCGDFWDWRRMLGASKAGFTLVLTNPPLGRRVPVPNLRGLIEELFEAAEELLVAEGRLVFVNPVGVRPRGARLRLEFRRKVDLGGFHCHLEKWVKISPVFTRRIGGSSRA